MSYIEISNYPLHKLSSSWGMGRMSHFVRNIFGILSDKNRYIIKISIFLHESCSKDYYGRSTIKNDMIIYRCSQVLVARAAWCSVWHPCRWLLFITRRVYVMFFFFFWSNADIEVRESTDIGCQRQAIFRSLIFQLNKALIARSTEFFLILLTLFTCARSWFFISSKLYRHSWIKLARSIGDTCQVYVFSF